jgi:hypothetical protein
MTLLATVRSVSLSPTSVAQVLLVVVVVFFLAYVLYIRHSAAPRRPRHAAVTTSQAPSTPAPAFPVTASSAVRKATPPNAGASAHTHTHTHTHPTHPDQPQLDLFTPPFDSSSPPFYHRATDTAREFPPVWVPVDSSIAKVLQDYRPHTGGDDGAGGCLEVQADGQVGRVPTAFAPSSLPPDFADVFRGYQRLALLSLHLAFGRDHRVIFVHKGNWSQLVPTLGTCPTGANGHMLSEAIDDTLRLDYVKSYILSQYGGYWFPPDTLVVRPDVHQWMQQVVLARAREDPSVPLDTPMLVVGGIREVQHGNSTEWFKDDSVLFAEPRNPAMVALAQQMHKAVLHANSQVAYGSRNWFTKALHVCTSSQAHPKLARSVVVLSPQSSGGVDDTDKPITAEQLFRQRPLDHLPHPHTQWIVVDTPDRRITSYPKFEWFAYMTEEAIVQSTLWISILYRRALGMDSPQQAGGTFRCTVSLSDQNHPLRNAWNKSWLAMDVA